MTSSPSAEPAAAPVRVGLEVGRTWVFATALDWPGWCRRGKGEHAALDALVDYSGRYAAVVGSGFVPGMPSVVGRVAGNATTDFGAPGRAGPWDDEPLDPPEAERLTSLVVACWGAFDAVAAGAPTELRKGPRGGGRDRDPIAEHVREAERSYGRKLCAAIPARTPWPEQRTVLAGLMRAGAPDGTWTVRYAASRIAWHVLDHAWEIEDKS